MTVRRLVVPSGLRVACLDTGPFARGRAGRAVPVPLVLLHGIGADRRQWLLTLPSLARKRRVLAFDLLGHGHSDKPDGPGVDYRVRLLAETVVEAIDRLPGLPGRVDLLGHSLGGAVALEMASRFPRLIRRLVLVDAACFEPAESLSLTAMSLRFAPRTFAEQRRLLATSVNQPLLNNALVAFAASLYKRRRNRPQILKLLASIAAGEDALTRRDLSRIAHPTLVLWGAGDRIFPVATGRRLAGALANARLEILPRCGHVPPTERPVAFGRRVLGFLDREDR